MSTLIAYATKYGSSQQIAERIAGVLRAHDLDVQVRPATDSGGVAGYDAFVVGSAVYYGSWLKEATAFVRRNQSVLAARPVWLFSSGPITADAIDAEGHDARAAAAPKETAELEQTIHARDHRVFFGKLDRSRLGFVDRLVASLPAFPGTEGDFRDWADVDVWAEGIADALAPPPAATELRDPEGSMR